MRIDGVSHILYRVYDRDAAIKFFMDALGSAAGIRSKRGRTPGLTYSRSSRRSSWSNSLLATTVSRSDWSSRQA